MVKPKSLCVAVFVPFLLLLLTCSTNYGFSSLLLLTSSILIIPTTVFLFKPTKKSVSLSGNPAEDEHVIYKPIFFPEVENKISQENDEDANMFEYQVESLDFPSDSESSDELMTGEVNWVGSNNVGQFLSISKEEEEEDDDDDGGGGLIEINLPGNDLNKEHKQGLPAEFMLKQQGLMELLAELNEATEEENLIEIDLSMGSVKCPMFEVEG